MILRPFLYDETACASYLFGCLTHKRLAVVDPHESFVDDYVADAERAGAPIVAVFETHVQADHVSGLPALVEATGATAYLPAAAGVNFSHQQLVDGDEVVLGNTHVHALATPGHAPAHNAYIVSDRRRGTRAGTRTAPEDMDMSMARWRKKLFIFLQRNAKSATEFFGIPPNRVVELGAQVEF